MVHIEAGWLIQQTTLCHHLQLHQVILITTSISLKQSSPIIPTTNSTTFNSTAPTTTPPYQPPSYQPYPNQPFSNHPCQYPTPPNYPLRHPQIDDFSDEEFNNPAYQYDDVGDDGLAYGTYGRFANPNPNIRGKFSDPNRKAKNPYPNHDRKGGYPNSQEYKMNINIPSFSRNLDIESFLD